VPAGRALYDARGQAMHTLLLGGISSGFYDSDGLAGFCGAYSNFLVNPSVPVYGNGSIKLQALKGPTVLGYMYGGIFSTVAQTSANAAVAATQTGAANQVFAVVLTPVPR
jgi:hypothetical protein